MPAQFQNSASPQQWTRRRVLQAAAGMAAGLGVAASATSCAAARRQRLATLSGPDGRLDDGDGFAGVTSRLQRAVTRGEVGGVSLLVARTDATLYEQGFGTFDLDHVDEIASATKLASASAIMALVDGGLLALDDRVSRFLPSFGGDKTSITVRQLLSHTSGLPPESDLLPPPGQDNGLSLAETVDRIARLPLVATPGSRFIYGGVSYQVAGRVAEVAAGQIWARLFEQRVSGPLQMRTYSYGATDNPRIGGGASCSLHDYRNLLQMHLARGAFSGAQVLSANAVAEMQRDQLRGAKFTSVFSKRELGYGLAWWFDSIDSNGSPVQVSDPGLFGAIPWIDLRRNYAAFLFLHKTLRSGTTLFDDLLPMIQQALDA